MRLALRYPRSCFPLLVRCELRLAAEFDAVRPRISSASCCAFEDAPPLQLGRYAKDREDDLREVGRGIKERLGLVNKG